MVRPLEDDYEPNAEEPPPSPPAARLWAAVLWRAIRDYVYGKHGVVSAYHCKKDYRTAEEWFRSVADASEWYSYAWVCQVLGYDPAEIRRQVFTMTPEQLDQKTRTFGRVTKGVAELARQGLVQMAAGYEDYWS